MGFVVDVIRGVFLFSGIGLIEGRVEKCKIPRGVWRINPSHNYRGVSYLYSSREGGKEWGRGTKTIRGVSYLGIIFTA